jgi:hypothetical protein
MPLIQTLGVRTLVTPRQLFDQLLRESPTLERSTELLAGLMSSDCEIDEDGTVHLFGGRQLVDRIAGLTIAVLPREHPPPHFHVVGRGVNATFSILDGRHLTGELSPKQRQAVEFWYPRSRALLIRRWNETRPTDCPVGRIPE